MTEDKDNKPNYIRQVGLLGSIPLLMAVGPIVGYFLGSWIDGWLNTKPWFTIVFLIFGFVASGKEIYNIVRKVNRDL